MPEAFNMCVKQGGKVRTKKMSGSMYMRICLLKGKWFKGEVRKKKVTKKVAKKKVVKKKKR